MTTLFVLTLACMGNAIGDVLMMYGLKSTGGKPGLAAIQATPDPYLKWGALSGLLTISAWFLLLPEMVALGEPLGWPLAYSFCFYVAVTLAFHLSYLFFAVSVKVHAPLEPPLSGLFGLLRLVSFGSAVITSLLWAADMVLRGQSLLYLLVTPMATILLFSVALAIALRSVPFYAVVSGPLSMLVFFCGFLFYVDQSTSL